MVIAGTGSSETGTADRKAGQVTAAVMMHPAEGDKSPPAEDKRAVQEEKINEKFQVEGIKEIQEKR